MATRLKDEEIKKQVVTKLVGKNPELSEADIQSIVDEEFSALADRPIRDFLVVLTERAVKQRIKGSAKRNSAKEIAPE